MVIKSLELSNFRNYDSLSIGFSKGVNIFYGDNAQGKTNILEAVYLGCTSRSQRAVKDREMIKFGEEEAHVRLIVNNDVCDRKIDLHLKEGRGKGIAIDGTPLKRSSDLYGLINIISFSPDDLSMIKNGPAERRKFIDMELCQLSRNYMYELSCYNKALMQRNNLLKQIDNNRALLDTLNVWDQQLCKYASSIISDRIRFTEEIGQIADRVHKGISGDSEKLEIRYQPSCRAENLEKELFLNHERDMYLKSTGIGPHRDDILFFINGEDARKYGSQGQQRTVALSLKLAEIELVKNKIKSEPVLLLDDVLSELDRNRQTKLLEYINDIQTMITCTGMEEFVANRISCDKVYRIEAGTVKEGELK